MLNLITSYYHSPNDERQQELNQCLINNAKNSHIKTIYLLNAQIYDLYFVDQEHIGKIVQLVVNPENKDRLQYDCAIQFANNFLYGQKCILSNSDIYFDDTLQILNYIPFDNLAFALSKYENGILAERLIDSQDSWIFQSPLRLDMSLLQFKFGVPGCDNVFADILLKSGYQLHNPCKSIVSNHLHRSNYRTYTEEDRIKGEYTGIVPCEIIINHS